MKYVVLLAVVAAWVSSSEAVTCENVTQCTPDISKLQGGGSKEDIRQACKSVKDAMQCFRDAMADCRKNQNIPEDTINKLEQQIDTYDQMLSGHCDDVGSGASGVARMSVVGLLVSLLALVL